MMLRRSNLCRIFKVSQLTYSKASYSGTNVDLKSTEEPADTPTKAPEHSKLVAAAFASLKDMSVKTPKNKNQSSSNLDVKIAEANDVEAVLSIADGPISKRHAFRIVSKLADWATMGRIKLTDFETDVRYAKVCRLLGPSGDLDDLSLVLGVTADEQAAKLISSISLPQMIKVMTSLTAKGRRSTPILRSLAFNIGRSTDMLDLKQATDVFYACATLNFPDEVLLAKVTADIISQLKDNTIPSVISSVAKSAGILKYRDTELFENLCNWVVNNASACRPKEYISLVLALAIVNYIPEKFPIIYQLLKPSLKENEMTNYHSWLDVVWSLVVLQKHNEDLIQSVLRPEFLSKMAYYGEIPIVAKMKLLNINGIAQQLGSAYDGPSLPKDNDVHQVPLVRTKDKQLFVNCVKDTFSNILNISECLQSDVDTGMGFLIDFECRLDSKSKPVKLSEWSQDGLHKVAIMVCSYHDVCRGSDEERNGITALNYRLLQNADYKLFVVSFNEFNPRDTLINRVQYLDNKLKNCLNEG